MKKYLLLLLSTILLMLTSCEDWESCPSDVFLDNIYLADSSKSFNPYEGNEVLTFEDSLGNQKVFKTSENPNIYYPDSWIYDYRILIDKLCEDNGGDDRRDQYSYYIPETISGAYESETDYFCYRLTTINDYIYEYPQSKRFFDVFQLQGGVGYSPDAEFEFFFERYFNYRVYERQSYKKDTVVLGKSFSDVYYDYSWYNDYGLMFSKEFGVVAIKDQGVTWVLK